MLCFLEGYLQARLFVQKDLENEIKNQTDHNYFFKKEIFYNSYSPEFVATGTIEKLSELIGLTRKELLGLIKKGVSKTDDISTLLFYDSVTRLTDTIGQTIKKGETIRQWTDRIGEDEILKKLGFHKTKPWVLDTIFETNMTSAINAGTYTEIMKNKEIEMITFYNPGDERTTEEICLPFVDFTRPKNDEIWNTITPPNHFKCRSDLGYWTKVNAEILGIESTPEIPDFNIPKEFQSNPAKNNNWLKSSKTMKKRIKEYEKSL